MKFCLLFTELTYICMPFLRSIITVNTYHEKIIVYNNITCTLPSISSCTKGLLLFRVPSKR